jgi:hypothetical protein
MPASSISGAFASAGLSGSIAWIGARQRQITKGKGANLIFDPVGRAAARATGIDEGSFLEDTL